MATFIARVKGLVRCLTVAGEVVSDSNLVNKVIDGLDASYESFRMALCLIPNLTEAKLTKTLMGEEALH